MLRVVHVHIYIIYIYIYIYICVCPFVSVIVSACLFVLVSVCTRVLGVEVNANGARPESDQKKTRAHESELCGRERFRQSGLLVEGCIHPIFGTTQVEFCYLCNLPMAHVRTPGVLAKTFAHVGTDLPLDAIRCASAALWRQRRLWAGSSEKLVSESLWF